MHSFLTNSQIASGRLLNTRLRSIAIVFLSMVLFFLSGCTHSLPRQNAVTHSPAFQWFLKGRSYLQQDELIQAEIAFNKALYYQRDFAPALNGLAQVYLAQNHPDLAEQYVQLALQGKPSFLPTRLTEIRLLIRHGEYEMAQEKLRVLHRIVQKKNLKLLKEPVFYYSALVAFKLNQFTKARKMLQRLFKINRHDKKAILLADSLKKRENLFNQIPQAIRSIAFKRVITRTDLAILLHYYFGKVNFDQPLPNFLKQLYPTFSFANLSDVDDKAEEAKWIVEALHRQLLWVYPDNTFRPADPVLRGEFALVLQRIYLKGGNPWELNACQIKITDVPEEDFIYPAVCLALKSHWLGLKDHYFRPQNKVNGLEAVRALQAVQSDLKPITP